MKLEKYRKEIERKLADATARAEQARAEIERLNARSIELAAEIGDAMTALDAARVAAKRSVVIGGDDGSASDDVRRREARLALMRDGRIEVARLAEDATKALERARAEIETAKNLDAMANIVDALPEIAAAAEALGARVAALDRNGAQRLGLSVAQAISSPLAGRVALSVLGGTLARKIAAAVKPAKIEEPPTGAPVAETPIRASRGFTFEVRTAGETKEFRAGWCGLVPAIVAKRLIDEGAAVALPRLVRVRIAAGERASTSGETLKARGAVAVARHAPSPFQGVKVFLAREDEIADLLREGAVVIDEPPAPQDYFAKFAAGGDAVRSPVPPILLGAIDTLGTADEDDDDAAALAVEAEIAEAPPIFGTLSFQPLAPMPAPSEMVSAMLPPRPEKRAAGKAKAGEDRGGARAMVPGGLAISTSSD